MDAEAGVEKVDTMPRRKDVSGGYGGVEDRSMWTKLQPTTKGLQWANLAFNPVVTITSLALIIGFAVWAMVKPEEASMEFTAWKLWVGNNFTWLYIGSQDAWAVFVVYLFFSKYGSVRLGPDGSRPQYNDASWFSMLFACGVSTGLFFYGVAEPLYHYIGPNRFTRDPSLPDNRLAQEAINITLYHWGLHGWVVYTVVGLLLALMAHREGLPLTMKSCFYPLIGDRIFGWPGDLVDILSVIATLFGVCTSLGLGTMQINQGLHLLNPAIPVSTTAQLVIIWCITAVATGSVLTGVEYGIRRISEFCFCCGLALMLIVLFMDNTVFLLNLYVQSMGYYFQNILQLGFHSDAFEQLGPSYGAAARGEVLPAGVESSDGPANWMNGWTIFYWGWWIAWCPFVGMFIAKISVGRTVKEFIAGTMAAPVVYVFMWMIIFGGSGLRMEREAAGAGLCCHNLDMGRLLNLSLAAPASTVSSQDNLCGQDKECNQCSGELLDTLKLTSYKQWYNETMDFQDPSWWGLTTPNRNMTRLSCRKTEEMWFDLMMSYGDLGPFLSVFSLISLILYFVTSSDSGSLVIDCLASNGHPDPPRLQRLLWAVTEGLTATALLVAGGKAALDALQAMSIATGLVYTILMCIACQALWTALQVETGELDPRGPAFSVHVLDPFFSQPYSNFLRTGQIAESATHFRGFVQNLFIFPWTLGRVASRIGGQHLYLPVTLLTAALGVVFIALHLAQMQARGCWSLALVTYITFCAVVTVLRTKTRNRLQIPGSPVMDFCISFCLWPSVMVQLDQATDRLDKSNGDTGMGMANASQVNGGFSVSSNSLAKDTAVTMVQEKKQ